MIRRSVSFKRSEFRQEKKTFYRRRPVSSCLLEINTCWGFKYSLFDLKVQRFRWVTTKKSVTDQIYSKIS